MKKLPIIPLLLVGGLLMGMSGTQPRGIRNNNPGNIRHTTDNWVGARSTQTDRDFVQFKSPEYGIRAMYKTLMTYKNAHGINTIRGIITRWAPPFDVKTGKVLNDTDAYIKDVMKDLGMWPDAALTTKDQYVKLIKSIIKHENGVQPYSDIQINNGISMS